MKEYECVHGARTRSAIGGNQKANLYTQVKAAARSVVAAATPAFTLAQAA